MKLLGEPYTVFNDYRVPAVYVAVGTTCTFKCVREAREKGIDYTECQNHAYAGGGGADLTVREIYDRHVAASPFVEAAVLSGLEPLDSFDSVLAFVREFRELSDLDVVVYTGYERDEVEKKVALLAAYPDVYVKFGRYDPSVPPGGVDPVGGVRLASGNQRFEKIS